jgi:primosomal protein N' (replication factor Y)
MPAFARIAVNVPSLAGVFFDAGRGDDGQMPGTFDYRVPPSLEGQLGAGHLVVVPFADRTVQGVVLDLVDQPAVAKTKEIVELVDPEPVLNAPQIALVQWMARANLSPMSAVIGLFLPPGIAQQADTVYELRDVAIQQGAPARANAGEGKIESRLKELLRRRGALRGRQIDRSLPRVEWRRTTQSLVRRGVLSSRSILPPAAVRPKLVRTAQLSVPPERAEAALGELGVTEATRVRRARALAYLIRQPTAVNVSWVYAESGCNLADLEELAERDFILLREHEVWRDPLIRSREAAAASLTRSSRQPPALTDEQQRAWQAIDLGFRNVDEGKPIRSYLLHGVTGSGKTELYLRATLEAVRRGKQAIVLVPEISLTPQTVDRFVSYLPGRVGLMHSKLSEGERYDTWRRARAGSLQVLIGARSALFAPLPRLGLLIVDECHDASYHQSEPPFYDAVAAVQAYAPMCGAVCILGSATPTVVQRYQTDIGKGIRLELTQRVASASEVAPAPPVDLPRVQIVDMREELKAGNRGIFSRELSEALEEVLGRGQQAILFLNRRGTATHVFCRRCGYVIRCPRCDAPLTYHVSGGAQLLCHRCGYARQMPGKCPECGSTEIRAYGLGTEKVEAEVERLFPKARTLRWDWETTRERDAHEVILHHFAAGHADVLIGTQMLAKGLDLPRVTLVGIVMADVGLYLPDPFAAERVFQVLTQVAGRAGRSIAGGRVVLQTFAPGHYAIQTAARHDVEGFHAFELAQRDRLGYPPFTRLLRLEYRHYDAARAEEVVRAGAASLRRQFSRITTAVPDLIGPAPCFFSKIAGQYRWQVVLRGFDFAGLLPPRQFADWRIEVDPVSLL